MSYSDKPLTCRDCGEQFMFTAGEQEFYAEKGFENEPTRCQGCRQNRKNSSRRGGGPREMHSVTCSECGKTAEVPFLPRGDKPVYCSDCYEKK